MSASKFALVLVFVGFGVIAAPPELDKKDEDAIRAATSRFFDAYGKRDSDLLGETLANEFNTAVQPSKQAYLKFMSGLFAKLDPTKYEAQVKSLRKDAGGTVAVRVAYKGKFKLKGRPDEVDDEGQWVLTLAKTGETWKLVFLETADAAIVKAVNRAKTRAEKVAIFRAEGDSFLVNRFLPTLFQEQEQLVNAGELAKAELAQEMAELATEAIQDEDDRLLCHGLCLLGKGMTANTAERYDEAAATYDEALALYRKKGWKTFEVAVYANQMVAHAKQGDFRKALAIGEEARAAVSKFNDLARMVVEAKVLGNLGMIYCELGNYSQAAKDLEESRRLAEKVGDVGTALNARLNLAKIRQDQSDYAEAVKIYEAALADVRRRGDRRTESTVLNNLALALAEQGRAGQAIRTLEDARKLAATIKNRREEATALANLSLVHFQVGTDEDAERYNREALKLYEAVGDKTGIARCWKLASLIYAYSGRKEEADRALAACTELIKLGGSKPALAELSFFLGDQYERVGQVAKASAAYSEAIRMYQELRDPFREMMLRFRRASMHRPQGGREVDLVEIARLERDVARLDDPRLSVPYFRLLAELHTEKKEWPQAIVQLRKAITGAERRLTGIDDPQQKAAHRGESVTDLYSHLVWVLTQKGDTTAAFQAADHAKARALTEMLERGGKSIQRGMTAAERMEEAQLRGTLTEAARRDASIRQYAANDPKARDEIKKQLADAEANYEAFRRRLFTTHPELRVEKADLPEVDLLELQKSLFAAEPDLAILLYLVRRDITLIFVVTAQAKPTGHGA
ncbi:MAG: tetratricopeptide repeat protein [Gemmataceae bacterium]